MFELGEEGASVPVPSLLSWDPAVICIGTSSLMRYFKGPFTHFLLLLCSIKPGLRLPNHSAQAQESSQTTQSSLSPITSQPCTMHHVPAIFTSLATTPSPALNAILLTLGKLLYCACALISYRLIVSFMVVVVMLWHGSLVISPPKINELEQDQQYEAEKLEVKRQISRRYA